MKCNFKQIAFFCKSNTILISRKVNIKKGNRVYIVYWACFLVVDEMKAVVIISDSFSYLLSMFLAITVSPFLKGSRVNTSYVYTYIHIYIYVCVCVDICVISYI